MAELKTKPTNQDVVKFLNGIADEKRRDCFTLVQVMQEVTRAEPKMWGDAIIGFGSYHYHYASGREADWFLTGFSPRKQNLTLYITSGFEQYGALLQKLGKHSTSKACLYVRRLEDIDLPTLKELLRQSVQHMVEANA